MHSIQIRFPALPTYDAAMLNRTYPELEDMLSAAFKLIEGHQFHGLLLHATTMFNVVGYAFGIDGVTDGRWFTSDELVHIGDHCGHPFIEDAAGKRLLLVSLAGENGSQCLIQKQRHISANRHYFSGTRHAVYGLVHFEDAATIRAALVAYADAGMGKSQNRSLELKKRATGNPSGEGPSLNEREIRVLASFINPNSEMSFQAVTADLALLELATVDAALQHYLDAKFGDPARRPDHIHELATNTSVDALADREVISSYDDEGIKELIFHVTVVLTRKAGWNRP
jgi:hypothetical protein